MFGTRHRLVSRRRRRSTKAGRVGNSNGTTSSPCLLPIIAMAAVIVSNFCFCSSLTFSRPKTQLAGRAFRGISGRIYDPSSSITKLPTLSSSTSLKASSLGSSWSIQTHLGRTDAQSLLDGSEFLPSGGYRDRIGFGRDAAEKEHERGEEKMGIMLPDDPRLAKTYAEFPLESLDRLLDLASHHLPAKLASGKATVNMVDIGSGLGRIVLYSALTRGTNEARGNDSNNANWEICGIEISPSLHNKALELVQTGIDKEVFDNNDSDDDRRSAGNPLNSFSFHCGSATDENGKKLLEDAHLVFAYSTAFKAKEFDPDVGALILDTEEWSLPLSEACPDGCVVVTTDRALNPNLGWRVVERLDVPNPEVLGTTGFIHVLEKERTKQ